MSVQENKPVEQPSEEKDTWRWWYFVLIGIGILGLSVYEYFDLTKFEQEGGSRTMKVWLAAIYNLVGKWGVVGIFAAIGVVLIAGGILSKTKQTKADMETR